MKVGNKLLRGRETPGGNFVQTTVLTGMSLLIGTLNVNFLSKDLVCVCK